MAQRLLNRAVRSSLHDAGFVADARRLASEQPRELMTRCLTNATLDEAQAELMCSLLARIPELRVHCTTADAQRFACACLRQLMSQPLPPQRQRATLLTLARLVRADSTAEHSAMDATRSSAEPVDAASGPLLHRELLLVHALLPLLHAPASAGHAARLKLLLQAALQLLSVPPPFSPSSSDASPARRCDGRVGAGVLCALLDALLELHASRYECGRHGVYLDPTLVDAGTTKALLRCTHAAVQLLLPHAGAAAKGAGGWLRDAVHQWTALPWRARMQVWPVTDRLLGRGRAPPETVGGGRGESAASRLVAWLREAARPADCAAELCSLLEAATVPSTPARAALRQLLSAKGEASAPAPGVEAPWHAPASAMLTPEAVCAALAASLSRCSPLEWQHAAAQAMPVLASSGLLPEPPAAPLPARDEARHAVLCAHALLRSQLALADVAEMVEVAPAGRAAAGRATGAPPCPEESPEERDDACGAQRRFALGLAKWLGASGHSAPCSLTTAHLLGVALRAGAEAPQEVRDRFTTVCFQLQQRLLEQRACGDSGGEGDGRGGDDGELQLGSGVGAASLPADVELLRGAMAAAGLLGETLH